MFGKRKQEKLEELANRPLMSSNVTQFMEKLGLSEEEIADMATPAVTVDEVQVKMDEGTQALNAFVNQARATWADHTSHLVNLEPFQMLPASLWMQLDKHDRTVLVEVMGLVPAHPWNIVLLAADEQTAVLTGAARLPMTQSEEAAVAIDMARLSITDEIDRVKKCDRNQLDEFVATRDAAAARIITLARTIGSAVLGQDAVDHSRATFFAD